MSTELPSAGAPPFIERAKNILLQPTSEWDRIAPEPVNVQALYTGYALPLAGAAAAAGAIGSLVLMHNPVFAIIGAAFQLALALAVPFVMALIINALAPQFGSTADQGQAHKLSVYSSTPLWVAGLLAIIPGGGLLAALLGGIYGLVLLYLGLPKLMKTPEDKAIVYFLVILGAAIVLNWVFGMIVVSMTLAVVGMFALGAAASL